MRLKMEIMYRKFIMSNVKQAVWYVLLVIFINSLIVFLRLEPIIFNKVTLENTIPVLELLIQIIGLITSLLMGYFFFAFQISESLKLNWYNSLKVETTKLQHIIVNLPDKFSELKLYFVDVQELFNTRQLRDYPIVGSDREPLIELTKVLDEMKLKYSKLTTSDNIFDQAINVVCNLEECASEIAIIHIRSFINKRLVNKIKKFLIFLAGLVLIDFILRLMTVYISKYFLFNISLFFIYFFIVMCLEITFIINDYMRNVSTQ